MTWQNIPEELRSIPAWAIAGPDKRPYQCTGAPASSTDPRTWGAFEQVASTAASWAQSTGAFVHIGFMLNAQGFACIDIDIKEDTAEADLMRFEAIVAYFDSYTERSASGRGYHIWVNATVGEGCRRDGVEVYDRGRFMICTGNIVRAVPMQPRQETVTQMISDIRNAADGGSRIQLEELPEVDSDEVVYERASNAANSGKFIGLWSGDWRGQGYPSQSEADLSLLSMFCFYSKSNTQVRRLFRLSGLGQREKAVKNDAYLNRTLGGIRSRQAREEVVDAAAVKSAQNLVDKAIAKAEAKKLSDLRKEAPIPPYVEIPVLIREPILSGNPNPMGVPWPPGRLGAIAKWMHSFAPRPVKEVAIVSALGFFAGITGRAFHISNSGLNIYVVLVGRSGVGKEALHSGISKLLHTMLAAEPTISGFVDFADYASGPALVKSLSNRSSFCNVAGEWGRKLKKMSDDHNEGPMASLRTAMTNLYQKSSAGTIVGGIGYSDKEKDVKAVNGVAYSMIGESTPETFYESLTNTMMQDGFMSRFIVMEYTGLRPPLNQHTTPLPLADDLVGYLTQLTRQAGAAALSQGYPVSLSIEAQSMLDQFNVLCDQNINASADESWRQMWNRAHLKALKVSGLLAVADNCVMPVVTAEHAQWALELVNTDIRVIQHKISNGDVGDGDMVRERKLLSIMSDYLGTPIASGYLLPDEMRMSGIVARKFFQIKIQRVNSFLKHRMGHAFALDSTIKSLVDSGYLQEISKDKIPAVWGSCGKCYRILALPHI